MIMKPSSLLLLPGCGFLLLQQPVHGLVPLLSSHRSIISNNKPPSYATARRRHPLLRDDRQEGVATTSAFAFASTPSSRLFFTPKVVATGGDGDDDGGGPLFIRPAPHNSSLFRSVSILCALLFAMYQGSSAAAVPAGAASANDALRRFAGKCYPLLPPHAAASVHLLSFSIWFGTVVHTTFVAGITMFKNLPRRVFGTLQSKLFPLYFRLCSGMIGVQVRELGYIAIVRSHSKVHIAWVPRFCKFLHCALKQRGVPPPPPFFFSPPRGGC